MPILVTNMESSTLRYESNTWFSLEFFYYLWSSLFRPSLQIKGSIINWRIWLPMCLSISSIKSKWGSQISPHPKYVCPEIHLIHYMEKHIFIPRKFNLRKFSKQMFFLAWILTNKVETNWASMVIYHMVDVMSVYFY